MAGIIANEIKVGNVLNHKNSFWKVVSTEHVKPGKGGAFMQVTMKNLRNSTKLTERFRAQEFVDRIEHDSVEATFLYESDGNLEFMLSDTFEQVSVPKDLAGDSGRFLQDGLSVTLNRVGEEIIGIQLPDSVVFAVVETEPRIKGATVTATLKPAKLENGVTVQVPQFVAEGDRIKVKTETGDYVSTVSE